MFTVLIEPAPEELLVDDVLEVELVDDVLLVELELLLVELVEDDDVEFQALSGNAIIFKLV